LLAQERALANCQLPIAICQLPFALLLSDQWIQWKSVVRFKKGLWPIANFLFANCCFPASCHLPIAGSCGFALNNQICYLTFRFYIVSL